MMMKIKNTINILYLGFGSCKFYSVVRDLEGKSLPSNTVSNEDLFSFDSWFAGFADAESSFSIVPKQDSKGNINRFTFMFVIGLHKDDYEALNFIKNKLNIGTVRIANDECKFVVTKKEEISKLISLFNIYKLNTSKYLDFLDFKKAFTLCRGLLKKCIFLLIFLYIKK